MAQSGDAAAPAAAAAPSPPPRSASALCVFLASLEPPAPAPRLPLSAQASLVEAHADSERKSFAAALAHHAPALQKQQKRIAAAELRTTQLRARVAELQDVGAGGDSSVEQALRTLPAFITAQRTLDSNTALLSCLRSLHAAQSAVDTLAQQLRQPLDAAVLSSLQAAQQAVHSLSDAHGPRVGRETKRQLDALEAGLSQGLEEAWHEAISVDVHQLRVAVRDSASAPTTLASLVSLLSQRSQLTLLVSALARSLTDFSAKLLAPAARWSIEDGKADWRAEAHGQTSGVAALSAFLRWLASRVGPLAPTLGSDFLPALQPHLLPSLSALLPHELPEPLVLPTEAAELARELHAALSLFLPTPTHYLKDDLQPLLLFASSQGGEWTKSLSQHALQTARVLLLDPSGWAGQTAELSVADLIAPGAMSVPTEDGANGDEGSEASWDWNAAAGGEEAAPSQEATAPSASGAAAASAAPGRRKGKPTLGGVRVVRPSAQLGSGPLPDEGEEDAWGFDEDALDVPTVPAGEPAPRGALQSLDGAHVAPIDVPEDDAWFADEDVPSGQVDAPVPAATSQPSSAALASEDDFDEDVDEDAWGLSEAEKARRASLRGIPAGWVPPPEPTLEGTLEEDEDAETSMIAPNRALADSLAKSSALSHASEPLQRQQVHSAAAAFTTSTDESAIATRQADIYDDAQTAPAPHQRAGASTSLTDGSGRSQIVAPLLSDDDDDLDDAWGLTEAEQVARAERRASRAFGSTLGFASLEPQKPPQSPPAALAAPGTSSESLAEDVPSPPTSISLASPDTAQSVPAHEERAPSALTAPVPGHASPEPAAAASGHDIPGAVPTPATSERTASRTADSAAEPASITPSKVEHEPASSHGRDIPPAPAESHEAIKAGLTEDEQGLQPSPAISLVGDVPTAHVASVETPGSARDEMQQLPTALPSDASAQGMPHSEEALSDERDPWDLDDEVVVVPGEAVAAKSSEAAAVGNGRGDDRPTGGIAPRDSHASAPAPAQAADAPTLPSTPPAGLHTAAENEDLVESAAPGTTRDEDAWGWNDEEAGGAAGSSAASLGAAVQLRSPSSRATPPPSRTSSPRGLDSAVAASPRLRQSTLRGAGTPKSARTSSPSMGSPSVSRSSSRSTAPPSQRRQVEHTPVASLATADKPATPVPLAASPTEQCQISARAAGLLALAERTLRSAMALAEHSAQMSDAQRSAWPDGAALSAAVGDMLDLHCALSPPAHAAQLRSASTAAQFANDCAFIAQATGRLQELYDGSKLAGRDPALDLTTHAQKTAALGQMTFAAELDRQADLLDDALDTAHRFEDVHDPERARSCEAAATRVLEGLRQLHATWQPILPAAARLGALGTLVEGVLSRVLREVEALEDISERESEILATVVKGLGPLEELFIDAASGQTAVALFVPSWFKCSYLSEILQGGLVDIDFLWSEAGALVDYQPEELSRLIRALFSDTPKRSKLLEKIALGHPQT